MRNILMILLGLTVVAQGADRYVSKNGSHDAVGGFTSWAGAATNIYNRIDRASGRVDMGCYEFVSVGTVVTIR